MRCLFFLVFCCKGLFVFSQQLKVGEQIAPVLLASNWKENQAFGLESGQLLLLDFWGTWCAPCIGLFPKLQAFKDKYEKSGLVVATLTDESPKKVKAFFENPRYAQFTFQKLIDSCIAGATEGVTFKNLGIETVPFSIIIDADRTIRWVGTTHDLEESTIQNLLSRSVLSSAKPVPVALNIPQTTLMPYDTIKMNGFTIVTRQVFKESKATMYNNFPEKGPVHNVFKGMALNQLLQHYYRISPAQVHIPVSHSHPIPIVAYQLQRDSGASWSEMADITNQVLSKKLGYRYNIEMKISDVWILEVADEGKMRKEAAPLDSTNGKSNQSFFKDDIITRNYTLQNLKNLLEQQYHSQIFEWKALPKHLQKSLFDFELPKSDLAMLQKRLGAYGIQIHRQKKELPYVIIKWNQFDTM